MPPIPSEYKKRAEALRSALGYSEESGWVSAENFHKQKSGRHALRQARDQIGVLGAFFLKAHAEDGRGFPIVYLAAASSMDEAKEIHRRVWCQGAAPFLLVLVGDAVVACSGFKWASQGWNRLTHVHDLQSVLGGCLSHLSSVSLRSSLSWRDYALANDESRVDVTLLNALEALLANWRARPGVQQRLLPEDLNRLIGWFIYLKILMSRKIITPEWLLANGGSALIPDSRKWPRDQAFRAFDAIDRIFNGSIFPLEKDARERIRDIDIEIVRGAVFFGDTVTKRHVQYSFLDFEFDVIRVETISSIYEAFITSIDPDKKKKNGVFYTPVPLADFTLDVIEQAIKFRRGIRVLDPASGSGIFLVGALRRIIENEIDAAGGDNLTLHQLHDIATESIYGFELYEEARNVAAFSVYLLLLDYISTDVATSFINEKRRDKLFPRIAEKNVLARDCFSPPKRGLGRFDVVVGNPPWQSLNELGSEAASEWTSRLQFPIGEQQAAEAFVWRSLHDFLKEDGVLGMVLPAKSFVNAFEGFRAKIANEYSIIGVANLSHLRYRLFEHARESAAVLALRNRRPKSGEHSWVFNANLASQPVSRSGRVWQISLHSSERRLVKQSYLRDPDAYQKIFVQKPIDTQIQGHLAWLSSIGKLSSIGDLSKLGIKMRRGFGHYEVGLPKGMVLSVDDLEEAHVEQGRVLDLPDRLSKGEIPASLFEEMPLTAKKCASRGNLVVARNLKFVGQSVARRLFNASFIYLYKDTDSSERADVALGAVGRFLRSSLAYYLIATGGRRWMLDRRNVEPANLAEIVLPFSVLDGSACEMLASVGDTEIDHALFKLLELNDRDVGAIYDFMKFRRFFNDGGIPDGAFNKPLPADFDVYAEQICSELDSLLGRSGAFNAVPHVIEGRQIGAVAVRYIPEMPGIGSGGGLESEAVRVAVEQFDQHGFNFGTTASIVIRTGEHSVVMLKPLDFFRWTRDQASIDGRELLNALRGRQ